ncbi:hypothetical protein AZH53_03095 [Methanomicrobiaceae archaeon CYW5]|nr:hypothetical protein [Methanovulcanius yangii]
MKQIQPGDRLIFYIVGEKVFAGYAQVTEGHHYDPSLRFAGDRYPHRVTFDNLKVLDKQDWVSMDPFKKELNFYNYHKGIYSSFIWRSPSEFDQHDAGILIGKIDEAAVK